MAEKAKLTPEQEEAERVLTAAGYVDEVSALSDGSAPMPEGKAEETPPEKPVVETLAEKPPEPLSAEELATLREQAKRGGWADREKDRADRERAEKDVLAVENARLRAALGTPTRPEPTGTAEEQEREKIALEWLTKNLDKVLPDALQRVSEESLGRHKVFQKRDAAILLTHDTVDQQGFLAQFDAKKQAIIRKRVLPELRQRRQASGWTKGYDELWEEKVAQERESAELYGNTAGPPARPATDHSADRLATPPHLAGVHGGQPKPRSESPPLSYDEMKVFGLA